MAHVVAVTDLATGANQHGAAFLQDFQRLGIQRIRLVEISHFLIIFISQFLGINPEVPAVFNRRRELHRQRQLARGGDSGKRVFDGAKGYVLACWQGAGEQVALPENAVTGGDDVGGTGIRQTGHESIIRLDRDLQRLVVGIDKLGETRQGYNGATELTPVFSRTIALLMPVHIERTNEGRSLTAVVVES